MEGVTGFVKSYGLSKGYGFIESDSVEGDIFFPKNALPSDLVDSLDAKCFDLASREVTFTVESKDGRTQARGVQLVPREGQPLVGKVKSFNPTKGYGFIGAQALMGQDVFFMRTELPSDSQHSQSLAGTPVSFCIVQTQEGKIQAQSLRLGNQSNGNEGLAMNASLFAGMDPTQLGLAIMNGQISLPLADLGAKGGIKGMGRTGGRQLSTGQSMSGTVKTFNHMKGWGFITSPSYSGDIYFKSGDGTITQGMQVSFVATVMPDGQVQARDVIVGRAASLGTPSFGGQKRALDGAFNQLAKRPKFAPAFSTPFSTQDLSSGHAVSGIIKSYHTGNGWGFIDCAGVDVYFKGNNLPSNSQYRTDLVGTPVSFEVNRTPDGKLQAMPGIMLGHGQS